MIPGQATGMAAFIPIHAPSRAAPRPESDAAIGAALIALASEAPVMTLMKVAPEGVVSAGAQFTYLAALALAVIGLSRRGGQVAWLGPASFFAVAIALTAWASSLWSILPDVTWRRALIHTATLLSAFYLASFPPWRLARLVAMSGLALVAGSAFLALAAPQIGVMQEIHIGAWSGFWLEKNRLGAIAALSGLACLACAAMSPRWGRWLAAAALCGLVVVMARSATSLAAMLLGVGVFAVIALIRRGPLTATVLVGAAGFAIAALSYAGLAHPDWIAAALGRDATFTGRTEIWSAVAPRIETRPWTGYGYGAFWSPEADYGARIAGELGYEARNAHNAWLELRLDFGFAGVVWIIGLLGYGLIAALMAAPRNRLAFLVAPLLVCALAMSATEAVFVPAASYLWLSLLAGILAMQRKAGEDNSHDSTNLR
jgi:O-antigen ligase